MLGPKLFILYISYVCHVSETLKPVLFADDTNLFCSGNDLQKQTLVMTELNKLKSWFNINKLSLNLSNTKIMHFCNWKSNIQIKVLLDDVAIEKVNEIRFLGVTIDDKISWNSHIKNVQHKVSQTTAVLNRGGQVLDHKALRTLHCSLVLPYLICCAEVWGNNYKNRLHSLFNTIHS